MTIKTLSIQLFVSLFSATTFAQLPDPVNSPEKTLQRYNQNRIIVSSTYHSDSLSPLFIYVHKNDTIGTSPKSIDKFETDWIDKIQVIKAPYKSLKDKYGEKCNNGVIVIHLKEKSGKKRMRAIRRMLKDHL